MATSAIPQIPTSDLVSNEEALAIMKSVLWLHRKDGIAEADLMNACAKIEEEIASYRLVLHLFEHVVDGDMFVDVRNGEITWVPPATPPRAGTAFGLRTQDRN